MRALRIWSGYTLAYFALLEAMLVAAILYWPNFQENVGQLKAMAPLPVLKDMVEKLGEGGVAAYVFGQHFFKGCNTLGLAAATLFACGAIAGEANRGTLEILLARPISRKRILTERWLAGALALLLPIFLSSATIPWLLTKVDETLAWKPIWLASAHQGIFLLAVYSLTFLMSAIGRNPILIAFTVLTFSTFQFSMYMVKKVTHYSLFRLVDLEDFVRIHTSHRLGWETCLPLLATGALATAASYFLFQRRLP